MDGVSTMDSSLICAISHPSRSLRSVTGTNSQLQVYVLNMAYHDYRTIHAWHDGLQHLRQEEEESGHDTAPGADHVLSEHLSACFVEW
jgi:hypothetical protein